MEALERLILAGRQTPSRLQASSRQTSHTSGRATSGSIREAGSQTALAILDDLEDLKTEFKDLFLGRGREAAARPPTRLAQEFGFASVGLGTITHL